MISLTVNFDILSIKFEIKGRNLLAVTIEVFVVSSDGGKYFLVKSLKRNKKSINPISPMPVFKPVRETVLRPAIWKFRFQPSNALPSMIECLSVVH